MNCTKCNTWNPDDKNFCWRCNAELPKPVAKPKKTTRTVAGLPLWMWLTITIFFVALLMGQCLMIPPGA